MSEIRESNPNKEFILTYYEVDDKYVQKISETDEKVFRQPNEYFPRFNQVILAKLIDSPYRVERIKIYDIEDILQSSVVI